MTAPAARIYGFAEQNRAVSVFVDRYVHRREVCPVVYFDSLAAFYEDFSVCYYIKSFVSEICRAYKPAEKHIKTDTNKRQPKKREVDRCAAAQSCQFPKAGERESDKAKRYHYGVSPGENIPLFGMPFPQYVFIADHILAAKCVIICEIHEIPPSLMIYAFHANAARRYNKDSASVDVQKILNMK